MDKYYTTAEVAERLKTNPQVIRASRVSGVLFGHSAPKFLKLSPRKILYPEIEVEKFMAQYEKQRITL